MTSGGGCGGGTRGIGGLGKWNDLKASKLVTKYKEIRLFKNENIK
jgi:hypothetical protein